MEIAMPTRMEINNFNSIKVQLELTEASGTAMLCIFQFHKGTIRTFSTFFAAGFLSLFQFHKGTIRTCCLTRVSSRISYFNSIKVQLEPSKA